jgi:hypothetical protein
MTNNLFEIARQFGGWIDGENLDEVRFNDDDFERFVNFIAAAERDRACRIVTGLCISDNNAHEINTKIRSNT